MDTSDFIENLQKEFYARHRLLPNALLINPLGLFKLNSDLLEKGIRIRSTFKAMKIVKLDNGEKTAVALI